MLPDRTGDSYENTVATQVVPWENFDPADPPMVLFDISKDPTGRPK